MSKKELEKQLEKYPVFMSIKHISEVSGLHHQSIWQKIHDGEIKTSQRSERKKHLVMKSEVIRWLLKGAKK